MLYYLFTYLSKNFSIPGIGVFQYITFRMAMAVITSLIVTTVYGRRLIDYLRYKQVGETVRNLGLEGQMQKAGTPTMGGIIIILGILIPTLLFAKLENIYVILMLVTTIWLGAIGFLDLIHQDEAELGLVGPEPVGVLPEQPQRVQQQVF